MTDRLIGPVDAWQAMDISLDLVIEAARRRLPAITPEGAGYIVLLATQQLIEQPCRVLPADLLLQEDGEVHVRPLPRASERDVEAALRTLLATLLALSPSPVPAISAVIERNASAGLRALASELSAALIPINHAAARRALARLYRETRRAGGLGVEAQPPTAPLAATVAAGPSPSLGDVPSPAAAGAAPALVPSVASEVWAELDIDVEIDRDIVRVERVPALPVPSAELRDSMLASSTLDAPARGAALPLAAEPAHLAEATLPPLGVPLASPSSAPRSQAASAPRQVVEAVPVPEPEHAASPSAASAARHADVASSSCRSNIRELLGSYLSHTRAEEPMTRALREMIGLAAPALRSDAPPSTGDAMTVSV